MDNEPTATKIDAPEGNGADRITPPAETVDTPLNTVSPKPPSEKGFGDAPGVMGDRLSGREQRPPETPGSVRSEEPIAIDLSKLTTEQLQTLKAMLNTTPDRVSRKNVNPIASIRRMDGKYVVNFGNAYLALVKDAENRREVERHKIPIQFEGEQGFHDVMYKDFMESDRVKCEIVKTYAEQDNIVEGEVYSKERGAFVEMEVTRMHYTFDVKTPEGSIIRIEGKVANA